MPTVEAAQKFDLTLTLMTGDLAQHKTIAEWTNGVRIAHRGHIEAAKRDILKHRFIGGGAAALGAMSATAVFANIRESPKTWVQVLAGALVLLTVSLTVINMFLNYAGRAASHTSASSGYGDIRRQMEERLMTETLDPAFLAEFRMTWTTLDRDAPTIPSRIYSSVFEAVTGRPLKPKKQGRWSRRQQSG